MLEALTIGDIVRPNSDPSSVDIDAPTGVIREVSDHSGHLRLSCGAAPASKVYFTCATASTLLPTLGLVT